eukprot:CAMPEP_0171080348 /NCGR_PEP_ID=MMETSP0766_2-20121228/15810_1 /TAXON_ID=439317 /ORGANISM="Gambierdiscus australes, Strain CAWD 149" /LENGTH=71 /DNA_ID=CAMNT_0011537577 /DNA_START=141 /DNA_END=356 /DNA_ORIENTATION=+
MWCTLADATTTEPCAEDQGYSDCRIRKDVSTLMSLFVGLLGSMVIAQLTGLQHPGFGKDAARVFSIHAMSL